MNVRLLLTRLLVVPAIVLTLVTQPLFREGSLPEAILRSTGLALLLGAAAGRIWAGVHVIGKKNDVLVTGGPYFRVRNPLYFFSFLGFVGTGLAFGSATLAALFGLVFFATHWPAIRSEEEKLAKLFGSEYTRYRESVPRFLPRLGKTRWAGAITIDTVAFAIALRESMAIPLVFILAELVRWARVSGHLPGYILLP